MEYDVLIIGGGPAGLTAGIYAGRAGVKTAIIERNFTGGQASETFEIENYPGFLKVGGMELTQQMTEQAEKCGAEIIYDEPVSFDATTKTVTLLDGTKISGKTIIIAGGATHAHLGIDKEDKLRGKGVSYCATCDGAFYKGKVVTVVGGGNTALADAIYLAKFASKVYLVHRRREFRASPSLTQRLSDLGIIVKTPFVPESLVETDGKLSAIVIKNRETDETETIESDGLFIAIGQTPDTKMFTGINTDEKGYIITDEDMRTNVSGIFAAGDIRQKFLRQVVTACGDGAIAAERAVEYVNGL